MQRQFIKRPVVVEAFRLGIDPVPDWFMDQVSTDEIVLRGEYHDFTGADIHTLEGWMHADKGDYCIQGVKGEIYPCKPDIFELIYESVVT